MKRKLVILFMFYSSIISAQWVQQESNNREKLTDVIMLDSTTAIAVGYWNSILKTTDAGKSWINLALPLSSIIRANAISFFDKNAGSIACDNGVVTTTNQLETWQWKLVLPGQRCLSVLQLDYNNIYVGTDSGWIYNSNDSGKTWASERPTTLPIRAIYPLQGNDFEIMELFALTTNSLFMKNEYPSTPWKEWGFLDYFQGLGSEAFKGRFSDNGTEFIVGVQGDLVALSTIIRLQPPDSHWYSIGPSFELGELRGLTIPTSAVVYTCGSNGKILKSTNGGDNWISIRTPTFQTLNSIYFFDEERGFAVGDSGIILFTLNGGLTNVESWEGQLPNNFLLYQNYPNPFNPTTKIKYTIPTTSPLLPLLSKERAGVRSVTLKVYDILGNEVATLVNKEQPAGSYEVEFDGSHLSSGIYFYQLITEGFLGTKKFILMK